MDMVGTACQTQSCPQSLWIYLDYAAPYVLRALFSALRGVASVPVALGNPLIVYDGEEGIGLQDLCLVVSCRYQVFCQSQLQYSWT